jgi:hypothetical protein
LIVADDQLEAKPASGGLLPESAHLSLNKIAIQSIVPRQMIRRTVLNHLSGLH